jgi:hypothetical protein
MKCNETQGKWCKNKHGASKIIDTFETYHIPAAAQREAHMMFATNMKPEERLAVTKP